MKISHFVQRDDGSSGVWSLFVFLLCIFGAAVGIDGTNGFRAKEHLQITADMAAHAGLVELANGGTQATIRQAVQDSVDTNMPREAFGGVLGDPSQYVTIGTFADGAWQSGSSGQENAVSVELHHSKAFGNAVRTFLLGFAGNGAWEIAATGTAVMDEAADCNGADGIYAKGEIKLTTHTEIGPGFCFYSKEVVELSNHNTFHPGAGIGMPDTAQCSHCSDDHNPGVEDALFEANLQLMDARDHIQTVIASLLGNSGNADPKNEFLKEASYPADLTPLADLDYQTNKISKGSVISISGGDFEAMSFVPPGLIYAVYCSSPLAANGAISPQASNGSSDGNSKKKGGGNANVSKLDLETGTGVQISDVAIVTDCQLDFGNAAYIVNSIVATTSTSNQSVSAGSKARIGSSQQACPSEEKVVIMTMGDLRVPAGMETNNVDFYIAGDAHLASGTSKQADRLGTSFYVDGSMHISAQSTWFACGDTPDSLTPRIEAIRQVLAHPS